MAFLRVAIRLSLLVLIIGSRLAIADAAEDWRLGTQAFQANDFAMALQHFESARAAGQTGPAVTYNIAVCEYKLGQFGNARNTFTELGDAYPDMRSLAEYNLGLVELKLENTIGAREHFRKAYHLSEDDHKLRVLSSQMLRQTQPAAATTINDWVGAFGASAGYDDNVALRDELGLPTGTTSDSPMADVFGSIRGPFRGRNGIRLDASAFLVRYFDNTDFNQSALRLGAYYDYRSGPWITQVGLYAGHSTLGGDGFDDTGTASVRFGRRISSTASWFIRYRYDNIDSANALFSGIDGSRQRVEARYQWFADDQNLLFVYQIESNDRNDPSVSPARNRLSLNYRYKPLSGWGFEIGGSFRDSSYDDLLITRSEDLTTLHAGISRTVFSEWTLLIRHQYSDNSSTDPVFSYERNQTTVGLFRTF